MAIMDRSMEGKRQYTTGISKGVFFGEDGKAFPWNGLISVTDKPQVNAPTPVYNSLGEKYDQFGNIAEKKHSLTCYTYPEEMDEFLGIEYLEEMGYSVDERAPKKFSMAYRTELGEGLYEIHVLLNQIATFADTTKNTITNNITPTVVTMNLEGVPDPRIKTSHIILDSRLPLTASAERLLFGNNMMDGNINEFLDAEPTWVTVATNYAPIIEPDYDNMVWLGGRNLIIDDGSNLENFFSPNNGAVTPTERGIDDIGYYFESYNTGAGTNINSYALFTFNSSIYSQSIDYSNPDVHLLLSVDVMFTVDATLSSTWGSVLCRAGEWVRISARPSGGVRPPGILASSTDGDRSTPVRFYHKNHKLERIHPDNPVPTPWTPAPENNYVPPSDQPRPANYVPSIKNSTPSLHRILFYDEGGSRLGIYSLITSAIYNSERWTPGLPEGISLRFSTIASPAIGHLSGFHRSLIALNPPLMTGTIPASPGTYDMSVVNTLVGGAANLHLRIDNNGVIGTIIYFDKLLVTHDSYAGGFFDVFTKPNTKGDRYVRVHSDLGGFDYTEHQQLMLQSKSRVILSDITPNQYTLEASDSQLRVDGQTFTFKGPQATPVGDDQFTIDDEIYGEE